MVKERFISILLKFKDDEISRGIEEIRKKYNKKLFFNDKLICFILKK